MNNQVGNIKVDQQYKIVCKGNREIKINNNSMEVFLDEIDDVI